MDNYHNINSDLMMTQMREQRLRDVVKKRQIDLTVLLDNIHDPHNISAILRTCDAVGIKEIYVLYSSSALKGQYLRMSKRPSAGTRKWVDVHIYYDVKKCMNDLMKKYKRVMYSDLKQPSTFLYGVDFVSSVALVFGNEHDGVSDEVKKYAQGSFYVPMMGMAQSLNVSVACAVTLFEVLRQRQKVGAYDHSIMSNIEQEKLFQQYLDRHHKRVKRAPIKRHESE